MHKASMLVLRSVDVKCIKQRSYHVATGMNRWRLLYIFINIELVIHLLTHRRSLDEDFEHNITSVTMRLVYKYL